MNRGKTVPNIIEAFIGVFDKAFQIIMLFGSEFRGGCFVRWLFFSMLRV